MAQIRNWRYLLSHKFEFSNNMFFILFMGLVIGWFTFICSILWIVLSVICVILLTIYNCNDLADLFDKIEKAFSQKRNEKEGCERGRKNDTGFECKEFYPYWNKLSNFSVHWTVGCCSCLMWWILDNWLQSYSGCQSGMAINIYFNC